MVPMKQFAKSKLQIFPNYVGKQRTNSYTVNTCVLKQCGGMSSFQFSHTNTHAPITPI